MNQIVANIERREIVADIEERILSTDIQIGLDLIPRAHLFRIKDAVHIHDPNNILTEIKDTENGVRITVNGASNCATPGTGAVLSVPLRDITGRPLGSLDSRVRGRPHLMMTFIAEELTAWSGKAVGTKCVYGVGVSFAPYTGVEPWAAFWGCVNDAANSQKVCADFTGSAGGFQGLRTGTNGHSTLTGVVGSIGTPAGNLDGDVYASQNTVPYEIDVAGSSIANYRVLWTQGIQTPRYGEPHLLIWVGCDGTSDTIEFAGYGIAVPVVNPRNLMQK